MRTTMETGAFPFENEDELDVTRLKRPLCKRCKRPERVCICAHFPLPRYKINTTIHVIQHPREQDSRLLTTVPLLQECVPKNRCFIYRGKKFNAQPKFAQLRDICANKNTVCLWPSVDSINIGDYMDTVRPTASSPPVELSTSSSTSSSSSNLESNQPANLNCQATAENETSNSAPTTDVDSQINTNSSVKGSKSSEKNCVSSEVHLIVIDGTWPQAKKMYYNNTFLHPLTKVKLSGQFKSEFIIRTQPCNDALSTLEATAIAVGQLENKPDFIDVVRKPLRAMCNIQIQHGAVFHHSKEELLERGIQYRVFTADNVEKLQKLRGETTEKLLREMDINGNGSDNSSHPRTEQLGGDGMKNIDACGGIEDLAQGDDVDDESENEEEEEIR